MRFHRVSTRVFVLSVMCKGAAVLSVVGALAQEDRDQEELGCAHHFGPSRLHCHSASDAGNHPFPCRGRDHCLSPGLSFAAFTSALILFWTEATTVALWGGDRMESLGNLLVTPWVLWRKFSRGG